MPECSKTIDLEDNYSAMRQALREAMEKPKTVNDEKFPGCTAAAHIIVTVLE